MLFQKPYFVNNKWLLHKAGREDDQCFIAILVQWAHIENNLHQVRDV